jgi:outer membrane protein TolC
LDWRRPGQSCGQLSFVDAIHQALEANQALVAARLTLDWSVLDGGAFIAQMNQSKAELWSLRSQRNNAATSLEQNIRSTAAAAMASFEQIGLAKKEAQAAKENYDSVNEAYLEGEAAMIELQGQ